MAAHVNYAVRGEGEDEERNPMESMSQMLGPGHVDSTIRQAIQACWMALPKERRNVEEVDRQIRRLVERALASFREDAGAFGAGEGSSNG